VRYPLAVVLVFVILAKLAGENDPEGIAHWVSLRKELLIEALNLKRETTPHPTTYTRILGQALSVEELQESFTQFLLSTVEVSGKENEIAAAPRVLKSVDLQGKIVTGDAMFAQRKLSQIVVERGGEYVWTVKDNQASLWADIEAGFEIEEGKTSLKVLKNDFERAETIEKGHGRIEQRRIVASSMLKGYLEWPGLEQDFKIEREVEEITTGKRRSEVSYGITSLTREEASAERLMEIVRGHWGIENGLHYRKDKTLREDACRLKRGEAAQVMAVINNLIIGLVLREGRGNLAEARRRYSAYPLEALNLILRR
jgi:predicted transposase YbfD/YdcC